MNKQHCNKIQEYLETCVNDHVFPGTTVYINYQGGEAFFCVGNKALVPDVERNQLDTIYDLASLSKVVVTTPIIMSLIENRILSLHTHVCDILKEFPFTDIEIQDLLTHTSGLPADTRIELSDTNEQIWDKICNCERLAGRSEKVMYSDLGFIILGRVIETVTALPLQEVAKAYIFDPLDMKDSGYCPSEEMKIRCAPTEDSLHFHKILRGEVHDRKAHLLHGVAGHAGVFSTIEDMSHVVKMHLAYGMYHGKRILSEASVAKFHETLTPFGEIKRGIGFLIKDERSPFAKDNSNIAYTHTGFAGTSILIDPTYALGIVILSNRIHPTRDNTLLVERRSKIYQSILDILEI